TLQELDQVLLQVGHHLERSFLHVMEPQTGDYLAREPAAQPPRLDRIRRRQFAGKLLPGLLPSPFSFLTSSVEVLSDTPLGRRPRTRKYLGEITSLRGLSLRGRRATVSFVRGSSASYHGRTPSRGGAGRSTSVGQQCQRRVFRPVTALKTWTEICMLSSAGGITGAARQLREMVRFRPASRAAPVRLGSRAYLTLLPPPAVGIRSRRAVQVPDQPRAVRTG